MYWYFITARNEGNVFISVCQEFCPLGGVCNGFEITFVSEKHVVENDVLFTNHLSGKWEILAELECCRFTWGGHGLGWLWLAQSGSCWLLHMTSEQCSVACHVTSDLEL